AVACVQFALSPPGVVAVALNTSRPQRIKDNAESVTAHLTQEFWSALRNQNLIAASYPYL
ncbi:MAG: aldo/keto reductase, partial [Planctomycetota bacterium]